MNNRNVIVLVSLHQKQGLSLSSFPRWIYRTYPITLATCSFSSRRLFLSWWTFRRGSYRFERASPSWPGLVPNWERDSSSCCWSSSGLRVQSPVLPSRSCRGNATLARWLPSDPVRVKTRYWVMRSDKRQTRSAVMDVCRDETSAYLLHVLVLQEQHVRFVPLLPEA